MYIISLLVHEKKDIYFGAAFEYSKVFLFSKSQLSMFLSQQILLYLN